MKRHVVIALIVLCACSSSTDQTRNEILAVVTGILNADNHADIEKVLSFYHTDAVLMPPLRDEIKGKENIRRNYEAIFATSLLSLTPEIEEITITKDFALCKGRTKGEVVMKADSSTRPINDKFMMILKKEEGSWKIKTLIWN